MKDVDKRHQAVLSDPYEFGFGIRKMKETKICRHCGGAEPAEKYTCSRCGERLPTQTLYQIYQSKHRTCEYCDTVLAPYMSYCPHCGERVKQQK